MHLTSATTLPFTIPPQPTAERMISAALSSTRRGIVTQARAYATHAKKSRAVGDLLLKRPDDVVITLALRTPMTRGNKGSLKDTPGDALLYCMLKAVNQRSGVDPAIVQDIVTGNVMCCPSCKGASNMLVRRCMPFSITRV